MTSIFDTYRCCPIGDAEHWRTLWKGRVLCRPWCWMARLFQLWSLRLQAQQRHLLIAVEFRLAKGKLWRFLYFSLFLYFNYLNTLRKCIISMLSKYKHYTKYCYRRIILKLCMPTTRRRSRLTKRLLQWLVYQRH